MNITGPICHPAGIRGFGNPDYGVVLIGIAPGHDEITKSKRPFTGASGKLLDDLLKFSGWHRDKIYTTNTVCHFNNHPTSIELDACRPRLHLELRELKPRVIVTAGVIANEEITGQKRRKGSRGSVTWSTRFNSYILDTHHPSYALQAQSMSAVQDIIRDLSKLPTVLDWPPDGSIATVQYSTVANLQEAQAALDRLPRDTPVAIDIETSNPDIENIDAFSDQLLCFALSYELNDTEYNIVVPTNALPECIRSGAHARAYLYGKCPKCQLPSQVLNWPLDVQWTFQAGQYDIAGLYNYFGVRLPLVDDTMLMSHCTDERPGYHGLKANAREYLGAGWYEENVKKYYKGRMNLLPPADLYQYNAKDAAYTRRLVSIHTKRMDEDGTRPLYDGLLKPAINTFIDMQLRGIKVDQQALQRLAYDDWFPKYVDAYKNLQLEAQEIGWPTADLNFNSNPQLRKLFFVIMGLDPIKYSPKTGAPYLDRETLDRLDHPFAAKLRAFRTHDTMIDYVLSIYENLKYDGLLHPSAFVTTTRTGRTSYHDPAMQTLPKDYTVGADFGRLRDVIVPHDTNTHEIIEADFQQIEVRIAQFVSEDQVLLEHINSGDCHSATAELAFNTKRELHDKLSWSVLRQNAKKIRFALAYGEGPEKLSSPAPVGLGCTVADARRFIENFWSAYKVHRQWTWKIQRQVANDGYLRTPSGRVMRFPIVMDHKALRQAINFPIQAIASDYCLDAMIELAPKLAPLGAYVILMIHDSIVVESPRSRRAEVIALIRNVMQKPRFGYPSVPVDMKVGDSLGAAK